MGEETGCQDDTSAGRTTAERRSDTVFAVSRVIPAPAHAVFAAWTRPDLFQRWWVPQSFGITLLSCEMDVRAGGTYCLTFRHPESGEPMPFHGRYLEVNPPSRLVWTNEEAGGAGQISTVTLDATAGGTLVVLQERFPSREALDEAIGSGTTCAMDEPFDQLEALLASTQR